MRESVYLGHLVFVVFHLIFITFLVEGLFLSIPFHMIYEIKQAKKR